MRILLWAFLLSILSVVILVWLALEDASLQVRCADACGQHRVIMCGYAEAWCGDGRREPNP